MIYWLSYLIKATGISLFIFSECLTRGIKLKPEPWEKAQHGWFGSSVQEKLWEGQYSGIRRFPVSSLIPFFFVFCASCWNRQPTFPSSTPKFSRLREATLTTAFSKGSMLVFGLIASLIQYASGEKVQFFIQNPIMSFNWITFSALLKWLWSIPSNLKRATCSALLIIIWLCTVLYLIMLVLVIKLVTIALTFTRSKNLTEKIIWQFLQLWTFFFKKDFMFIVLNKIINKTKIYGFFLDKQHLCFSSSICLQSVSLRHRTQTYPLGWKCRGSCLRIQRSISVSLWFLGGPQTGWAGRASHYSVTQ